MSYALKELPLDERPRERLEQYGSESLASSELIAIILGSGMRGKSVLELSKELIQVFGSLADLANASLEEMCRVKGLGKAKAIQLKAAFSLGLRAARQNRLPDVQIRSPLAAYNFLRDGLEKERREVFQTLLLDSKCKVMRVETVSIGSLTNSLIHPREVFHPAIKHQAASLILAHNHPSGDPTPSKEDYDVTRHLVEASKVLGIRINDHLIIGHHSYRSLSELGVEF